MTARVTPMSTDAQTAPLASPCQRICQLDASGVCVGCLRTVAEIAAWGSADTATRLAILQRLTERERERRS